MGAIKTRLTFANVVACIALFVALGGVSYAAFKLPKNSVGSQQIRKEAVNSAKVKNGSLKAADFEPDQVPAGPRGATGAAGPKGEKGDAGPQGPKGDTGARGPSDTYYAFNNDNGTNSKTLTLAVPAGSYAVSASMYAVNQSTAAFGNLECKLKTTNSASLTLNEGGAALTLFPAPTGSDNYQDPTARTAFTVGAGGGTISWTCSRFEGTAAISLYQARIVATQVETLH